MYKTAKDEIDIYNDNYDSLTSEEQELIYYFKEKLQDDDFYNIGSTSGIITRRMEEKYDYILVMNCIFIYYLG